MRQVIFTNATLATLTGDRPYGLVKEGVLAIEGEKIVYAGPATGFDVERPRAEQIDLEGRLVTPGLIDCHTHLIYGGSRAREFEMRLNGATYEQIARAGGGIFSTVEATRAASDEELLSAALRRLDNLITEGVTTVEIKSGYGLDRETELRQLKLARQLADKRPVEIVTTFLGAHAIPKGMDADEYLDDICIPALKDATARGLVDMVDGFCEGIAFRPDQIEKLFNAAKDLNLPLKLHAEQLSALGGSSLAAQYGALSADHLEFAADKDIEIMAKAGTVAVMLPGAYYFLKDTNIPPIEAFRKAGVPMAVATDSNPGSSPMTSLLLAMNMAATLFGLTPEECLRGVTQHAATALGLQNTGTLATGQMADIAIWDLDDPAELTYRMGDASLHQRIFRGQIC